MQPEDQKLVGAFFVLASEINKFLARCAVIEPHLTGEPLSLLRQSQLGLKQALTQVLHDFSERDLIERPPITDKTD